MNYQLIYNAIIDKGNGRTKVKIGTANYVYYEYHHKIPKCVGGTDEKSNIVCLTPEEHWVAHLLLVKMYPGNDKLVFACQAMSMAGGNNKRTTNKLFGWIRKAYSKAASDRNRGKVLTQEHKDKISKTLTGRPALHQIGDKNVTKRPEVAKKISEANTGKINGPRSLETKQKISIGNKGHRGLTGEANPATWRVSCIFCKKETSLPVLGRNHKTCN